MKIALFSLLGVIVAALVAGYFNLMALINAKEQKTSEFRQNWIDALRKDISELVAAIFYISYYTQTNKNKGGSETPKDLEEAHKRYVSAYSSIALRVNPSESNPTLKLINDNFLNSLQKVLDEFNNRNYSAAASNTSEVLERARPLLKEEWKRVKTGEEQYRKIKKYSTQALTILALGVPATLLALAVTTDEKTKQEMKPEFISQPATAPISVTNNNSTGTQECSISLHLEQAKNLVTRKANNLNNSNTCQKQFHDSANTDQKP
jgi:hypothetical protein